MSFYKEHKNGIMGALLFHFVVVLLMIFLGFTAPFPPREEDSILINFGTDDVGSGTIQPEADVDVLKPPTEVEDITNEEIVTQDIEEAPLVEKKPVKTSPVVEDVKEVEEIKEVEPEVNTNMLFNTHKPATNSASEGDNGNKKGDKGDEIGDANSNSYAGTDSPGKGISFSLAGRKPNGLPKPDYQSNEQGTVVVEIKVDRSGTVVAAVPGYRGTTTQDNILWQAAKKAALATKWNKKLDASEFQIGTITYNFVLQ